jgi:hypothetical protein
MACAVTSRRKPYYRQTLTAKTRFHQARLLAPGAACWIAALLSEPKTPASGKIGLLRIGTTMPLVYRGAGWFIGIALVSALRLPVELLLLPEPQASLLSGILLGIDAVCPPACKRISASPARRTSLPSVGRYKPNPRVSFVRVGTIPLSVHCRSERLSPATACQRNRARWNHDQQQIPSAANHTGATV